MTIQLLQISVRFYLDAVFSGKNIFTQRHSGWKIELTDPNFRRNKTSSNASSRSNNERQVDYEFIPKPKKHALRLCALSRLQDPQNFVCNPLNAHGFFCFSNSRSKGTICAASESFLRSAHSMKMKLNWYDWTERRELDSRYSGKA